MSKKGMKVHQWSESDIEKLKDAVLHCEPLFKLYSGDQSSKYSEVNAWDAVAGRLVPDIVVTGNACLKQWKKVTSEMHDNNHAMTDGWLQAVVAVQEHERTILERIEMDLESLSSSIRHIERELISDISSIRDIHGNRLTLIESKLDRILKDLGVSDE